MRTKGTELTLADEPQEAEFVCADQAFTAPMPSQYSFSQAAIVPLAGLTAQMCVDHAAVQRVRTAFVAGASGGVGSFLIPLLRTAGVADITVTAGSAESAAYCEQHLGVRQDHVVRYDELDRDGLIETAMNANRGNLFDLCVDLVGHKMHSLCADLVDFEGTMISIVTKPEPLLLDALASRCVSFRFLSPKNRARFYEPQLWDSKSTGLNRLLSRLTGSRIPLPKVPVVGAFSEATVKAAHTLLEAGGVPGKLVMTNDREE